MTKLSAKGLRYLRLVGKTQDASAILTKGFAKQAGELQRLGFAVLIPVSSGGCQVALTKTGLAFLDSLEPAR